MNINIDEMEKYGSENNVHISMKMLSPERLLELSHGEILTADTLNYRSLRPAKDGLFTEKIFGPVKDWECHCGKYKKIRYKGIVCDNCGVEVASSRVRRERFGHIELGCNIVYPQYLYGNPSILSTVLEMPQNFLENIVFLNQRIDVDGYWEYKNKLQAIKSEETYWGYEVTGVDALKQVLELVDLEEELQRIEQVLEELSGYLAKPYLHRREVLKAFIDSGNRPDWMIGSKVLVLPADLRPIMLHEGKIVSSEINERYLTIIRRSHLLQQFQRIGTPKLILDTQMRMIQFSVDALFDSKLDRGIQGETTKESLIQKRRKKVCKYNDYSASGSIIANSQIDMEEIGIPIIVAREIFKPFIAAELVESGLAYNIKGAFKLIERGDLEVDDTIEDIQEKFVVLVTSDPQKVVALKVHVTLDNYFSLNPAIYHFFDFDKSNNQKVKVFAQLSEESRNESLEVFGVKKQIISDTDNSIQIIPNTFAFKWLVEMSKMTEGKNKRFISPGEVYCAYSNKCISMTEKILIHCHTANGFDYEEETTLGRLIINEILPQNMGIVNRRNFKNKYSLEYNFEIDEIELYGIFRNIYNMFGAEQYIEVLRKFDSVIVTYLHGVDVRLDEEKSQNKKNDFVAMFDTEYMQLKTIARKITLVEENAEVRTISINYNNPQMLDYFTKYLNGRVISANIYDFADVLVSKGTIVTEQVLAEIVEKEVSTISIFDTQISVDGKYPRLSFGKEMQGEPAKIAVLGIINTIGAMKYEAARLFLDVLFENNILIVSKLFEEILTEEGYAGEIWNNINSIWNHNENMLFLNRLNRVDCTEVKLFLLYRILKSQNMYINIRLLDLTVKAIAVRSKSGVEGDSEQILIPNKNISIQVIGENAIKGVRANFDDTVIKSYYGSISANALKQEANSKKVIEDEFLEDEYEFGDDSDEFDLDEDWEFLDFEDDELLRKVVQ